MAMEFDPGAGNLEYNQLLAGDNKQIGICLNWTSMDILPSQVNVQRMFPCTNLDQLRKNGISKLGLRWNANILRITEGPVTAE